MMARSSNAPSMGRIQKRKTNLSKSSLSACNARPVHTDGPVGDIAALYSITSSAVARSLLGTSRPSALAVLRLMTRSYFVGCMIGISDGFAPLRMRPA